MTTYVLKHSPGNVTTHWACTLCGGETWKRDDPWAFEGEGREYFVCELCALASPEARRARLQGRIDLVRNCPDHRHLADYLDAEFEIVRVDGQCADCDEPITSGTLCDGCRILFTDVGEIRCPVSQNPPAGQ